MYVQLETSTVAHLSSLASPSVELKRMPKNAEEFGKRPTEQARITVAYKGTVSDEDVNISGSVGGRSRSMGPSSHKRTMLVEVVVQSRDRDVCLNLLWDAELILLNKSPAGFDQYVLYNQDFQLQNDGLWTYSTILATTTLMVPVLESDEGVLITKISQDSNFE